MHKTYKFVEKTKIWFTISIVLIAISLGSWAIMGLNFGIDFVGGTIITINLHTQFTTDEIREITNDYDTSADITYSGDAQDQVVISTKESLDTEQRAELFSKFQKKYNLAASDLISADTITPSVGAETTRNAVLACLVAMALMLVYVSFRFEFYFGLAAIIALFHDIIIVLGVYALFRIQVNSPFIAAELTILGYSINDTIVVFDRIRENETIMGMRDLPNLVNASISQTLKRSINTVATTLIAILALYIWGVASIRDFALPLIVGIASGCYSSIFVASPLWVIFQKHSKKSRYNSKQQKDNKKRRDRKQQKQPQV
jgi:preprotein translocase subunit SecF